MSELAQILVAVIAAAGLVLAATLPVQLSTRKHAKVAAEQTTNAHATNLRDDLDQKHADNVGRLGRVEKNVVRLERGISRIETHLGLEQTLPAPPRRSKKP